MRKIYLAVIFSFLLYAGETHSFIVLDHADKAESLEQKRIEGQTAIQQILKKMPAAYKTEASMEIKHIGEMYILRSGPYQRDDHLAGLYLSLKELFPKAMIFEEEVSSVSPMVKTEGSVREQKVIYRDREVIVEKEDITLWIAIFGLAIIGILYMFLSSDTLKRLKSEYDEIKEKHKKLEEKQQEVLNKIGDSIHTIAKETMSQTQELVEKVKDTELYSDMVKVAYNENELLDVTGDLIQFLRLKSKKVTIHDDRFDINSVLNEVSGLLYNTFGNDGTELVFDIDKDMPRYMFSDSTQMSQILINLLEFFIKESIKKQVILTISVEKSLMSNAMLRFNIYSDVTITDKEELFNSYYDEKSKKYVGLGLFVAKELVSLMRGKIEIQNVDQEKYHSLDIMIPIKIDASERRKYRLSTDVLKKKKALIIDAHIPANAIARQLQYFRIQTRTSNLLELKSGIENFDEYDLVLVKNSMLTAQLMRILSASKRNGTKVISLESLFSSNEIIEHTLIDMHVKKPLSQRYLFDILSEIYEEKKVEVPIEEKVEQSKLLIHRDPFPRRGGITMDSFGRFSGYHILIVEDNIINQKVLLSMLAKANMKLSIANNGQEAVDMVNASKEKIDFILMDINMPIMDGNMATEILKKDDQSRMIPIVALSALNSEYEIEKMFHSGVNGYLPKPVYIDTLYAAFDTFLEAEDIDVMDENKINYAKFEAAGLNVNAALEQMNRDDILYRELLKEFLDAYAQSDKVFEGMVIGEKFEHISMLCLDMKGLSGTIGATNMYSIVDKIHRRIIQGKTDQLGTSLELYKAELNSLIYAIETYLES